MKDLLDEADRYRVRAHRKARSHYLAAKQAQKKHIMLGAPVVVATTIVGTTIFATLSKQPDVGWQIATGILSIAAAVLAALQTFFRYAEAAEKHRQSASSYAALYRSFNVFKLKHNTEGTKDRQKIIDELETLLAQFNQLETEGLDVSDRLYDQAVKEQAGDAEGI